MHCVTNDSLTPSHSHPPFISCTYFFLLPAPTSRSFVLFFVLFFAFLRPSSPFFALLRPFSSYFLHTLQHFGVMPKLGVGELIEDGAFFCSPEVLGGKSVAASDVWSAGCVLAWMLQSPLERRFSPLFAGTSPRQVSVLLIYIHSV